MTTKVYATAQNGGLGDKKVRRPDEWKGEWILSVDHFSGKVTKKVANWESALDWLYSEFPGESFDVKFF